MRTPSRVLYSCAFLPLIFAQCQGTSESKNQRASPPDALFECKDSSKNDLCPMIFKPAECQLVVGGQIMEISAGNNECEARKNLLLKICESKKSGKSKKAFHAKEAKVLCK